MKLSQESIVLVGCAVAIGALIIWINQTPAPVISPAPPIAEADIAAEQTPAYTQYNTNNLAAGYNLPPPLSSVNVVPPQSMGIAGAIGTVANMMGCKSCG